MEKSDFVQKLDKFQYLQFTIPDVNSIPRGKIVTGDFREKVARTGFEANSALCFQGPNSGPPTLTLQALGRHNPNENMRPCLDTLTPWPWVGKEGRRVGNVLCDLIQHDGTPDLTSPRQLLKAQLDALWQQQGLVLKTAFEYEFDVLKESTLEPLGGDNIYYLNVRNWAEHQDLFCDLTDMLSAMGIDVHFLLPELAPGQWEITTEPHVGLRGGDVAFYIKNAVKGFFHTRGYQATFMTKPTLKSAATLLNLNHSLWSKTGDRLDCAMLDKTDPNLLSSTARHWLAGILTHAPALTALCRPTLNCYHRLFDTLTPGDINWDVDNRNAMIRVHNAHDNVFFENRLPSGPCSPYLAIAATVAAGLDGINRKLPCPRPLEAKGVLPTSLPQALQALEKDHQLCSLLGDRFVEAFISTKRGGEISVLDSQQVFEGEEERLKFERDMYMKNL